MSNITQSVYYRQAMEGEFQPQESCPMDREAFGSFEEAVNDGAVIVHDGLHPIHQVCMENYAAYRVERGLDVKCLVCRKVVDLTSLRPERINLAANLTLRGRLKGFVQRYRDEEMATNPLWHPDDGPDPVAVFCPLFTAAIGASIGEVVGFWGVVAGTVAGFALPMFNIHISATYASIVLKAIDLVDSARNRAFAFFWQRA